MRPPDRHGSTVYDSFRVARSPVFSTTCVCDVEEPTGETLHITCSQLSQMALDPHEWETSRAFDYNHFTQGKNYNWKGRLHVECRLACHAFLPFLFPFFIHGRFSAEIAYLSILYYIVQSMIHIVIQNREINSQSRLYFFHTNVIQELQCPLLDK